MADGGKFRIVILDSFGGRPCVAIGPRGAR